MIPLGRRWKSNSLPSTTTVCPALLPPCKHKEKAPLTPSYTPRIVIGFGWEPTNWDLWTHLASAVALMHYRVKSRTRHRSWMQHLPSQEGETWEASWELCWFIIIDPFSKHICGWMWFGAKMISYRLPWILTRRRKFTSLGIINFHEKRRWLRRDIFCHKSSD